MSGKTAVPDACYVGLPDKFRSMTHLVRSRRYTPTDDKESDTARPVYCPARNGLLYSRRSSLNFTILRVYENLAQVPRGQPPAVSSSRGFAFPSSITPGTS